MSIFLFFKGKYGVLNLVLGREIFIICMITSIKYIFSEDNKSFVFQLKCSEKIKNKNCWFIKCCCVCFRCTWYYKQDFHLIVCTFHNTLLEYNKVVNIVLTFPFYNNNIYGLIKTLYNSLIFYIFRYYFY